MVSCRDIPQGATLCLAVYAVYKKKKKEEKVRMIVVVTVMTTVYYTVLFLISWGHCDTLLHSSCTCIFILLDTMYRTCTVVDLR